MKALKNSGLLSLLGFTPLLSLGPPLPELKKNPSLRLRPYHNRSPNHLEGLERDSYFCVDDAEELVEEIFDGEGRSIAKITRNRYGALILNSQSLLFADIDLPRSPSGWRRWFGLRSSTRAAKKRQLARIERFAERHPQYELVVYETFAGFRVAIANHHFSPDEPHVEYLLTALGSDPLYKKLCCQQHCFRARLTPKPWRCELESPPGQFPFSDENEKNAMAQWLRLYDERSIYYCVCRKLGRLGSGGHNSAVQRILTTHDAYVLGTAQMPLA